MLVGMLAFGSISPTFTTKAQELDCALEANLKSAFILSEYARAYNLIMDRRDRLVEAVDAEYRAEKKKELQLQQNLVRDIARADQYLMSPLLPIDRAVAMQNLRDNLVAQVAASNDRIQEALDKRNREIEEIEQQTDRFLEILEEWRTTQFLIIARDYFICIGNDISDWLFGN